MLNSLLEFWSGFVLGFGDSVVHVRLWAFVLLTVIVGILLWFVLGMAGKIELQDDEKTVSGLVRTLILNVVMHTLSSALYYIMGFIGSYLFFLVYSLVWSVGYNLGFLAWEQPEAKEDVLYWSLIFFGTVGVQVWLYRQIIFRY